MALAVLRLYGERDQTRSDHLGLIAKYLEWQTAPAGSQAMKELGPGDGARVSVGGEGDPTSSASSTWMWKRNWPNSTPPDGAP